MGHIDLDAIYKLPNKRDDFFRNYDSSLPLILYGCGNRCADAIDMFISKGIKPTAICDSNECKQGTMYQGIPVISIQKAQELYNDFYVFISAPLYYKEIKKYLSDLMNQDRICFFENFTEQKALHDYLVQNYQYLNFLYNQLGDEDSQKTLVNMLKAWVTCNNDYFVDIFTSDQYFPPKIIRFSEKEIFVDAGAFIGDTIMKFIEKVNGRYHKIYAFEPNVLCHDQLDKIRAKYHNVVVIPKGAFEYKDKLSFYNTSNITLNERAHITNDGNQTCTIEVDSIDNLVTDHITFLKMDIEGSELSALKGAKNAILNNKPKLAICVYHQYQDIIDIPKYLMSLGLDYKYYLRHHSCYRSETVLYAV